MHDCEEQLHRERKRAIWLRLYTSKHGDQTIHTYINNLTVDIPGGNKVLYIAQVNVLKIAINSLVSYDNLYI